MVITVTFNPSLDYNIEIRNLEKNVVNRFESYNYMAGGKGINISTLLNNIGINSIATGFVAGFTGKELTTMLNKFCCIDQRFVEVGGETRLNVKIHNDGGTTEMNGIGPNITEDDFEQLFAIINRIEKIEYLVVAGSPPSNQSNAYKKLLSVVSVMDIKVIIDTTKDSLLEVLEYKPFLIKPNHHELGDIFDVKIHSKKEAIDYAKKLLDKGVGNIIISLGKDGAIFINKEIILDGIAPIGDTLSTVGAGDSMLAGFVAKFSETDDFYKSFKFAIACGTATAFSDQIAKVDLIDEIYNKVQVKNYEDN